MRRHSTVVVFALVGAIGCNQQTDSTVAPPPDGMYKISLFAATASELPSCASPMEGDVGYVASPPSLYTCNGSRWTEIVCNDGRAGNVAYASVSNLLLACIKGVWSQVELPEGPQGPQGIPGVDGTDGLAGANSLVVSSTEPPGAVCTAGGQRFDTGVDLDRNGKLDGAEIQHTAYVCNGTNGTDGVNGSNGADGKSSLMATADVAPGDSGCLAGGKAISIGLDEDGSGTLDPVEVASTQVICNGISGPTGPAGPPGVAGEAGPAGATGESGTTSLVSVEPVPSGSAFCPSGGQGVSSGLDTNGNGMLDAEEVQATQYVCNGKSGSAGLNTLVGQAPEPAGAHCENGGILVTAGLDTDANGALDAGEVTSSSYVCNGAGGGPAPVASFEDAVCDPLAVPNDADGVFVDPLGGSDAALGTRDAPLKTAVHAVTLAVATGKRILYLAEGTYHESLTLPAGTALYIEGSWTRTGSTWHRNCSPTARQGTVLASGVVAPGPLAGLRSLTINSDGSSSSIAVRAVAGHLILRNVGAIAKPGSDGVPGVPGAPGLPGSAPTLACADGSPGVKGADGEPGRAGVFLADGTFLPGHGGEPLGFSGAGANGPAGVDVTCNVGGYCAPLYVVQPDPSCGYTTYTYACGSYSCNCGLFGCSTCTSYCTGYHVNSCPVITGCGLSTPNLQTLKGYCGQGGGSGRPGTRGAGGGASLALAIASAATVEVIASSLVATSGGNGGPGGMGGPGGVGGPAGEGESGSCVVGCGAIPGCAAVTQLLQATPGGPGGMGAPGPDGGAGAGGPSYAVVKIGGAIADLDAQTTLVFGNPGRGGSGAPDGTAGEILVQ